MVLNMNEKGKKIPDYEKIDEDTQLSKYTVASLRVIGIIFQEQYSKCSLKEKYDYLFSLAINECIVKDSYLMKTMGQTTFRLFVFIGLIIFINGMFFNDILVISLLIPGAVLIAYNYFNEHSKKVKEYQHLKQKIIAQEFMRLQSSLEYHEEGLSRYIKKYGEEFDYRKIGGS